VTVRHRHGPTESCGGGYTSAEQERRERLRLDAAGRFEAGQIRGRGSGRVNIAGVLCFRPGDRPHLLYRLHVYRGRRGEPKTFGWQDYPDLIIAAHQQLGAPLVWCWDNLNVHLARELADFAAANKDWLRTFRCPPTLPS